MTTSPVRIKCPKCSVTLQIKAGSSGSLIVCPKCSQQIRIKSAAAKPLASAPAPAARPAARPPAAAITSAGSSAVRPIKPAAPSGPLDWDAMPTAPGSLQPASFQPAAQSPAGQPFPGPSSGFGKPVVRSNSGRGAKSSGVLKKVGIAVSAIVGLGVLLMVAVLALIAFAGSRSDPSQKLSLNGWAVDAPGRRIENSKSGGAISLGTVNSKTNSEFSIAVKTVGGPGTEFSAASIADAMQTTGITFTGRRSVQRAGLDGVHAVMRPQVGPSVEVEIFKIDATQVLLLTYVTAESKEKAGMGLARQKEPELTKKLDSPDSFFESLRRDG